MGIVVITMPGAAKRSFVNALHRNSGKGVSLVIIQRSATDTRRIKLKRSASLGLRRMFSESWYGLIMRLSPHLRSTLAYFRDSTVPAGNDEYLPKTLIVDQVNSDEVHTALAAISPDLLVVWGSKVLEPRIIKTAKNAINLHMGRCPKYRGTLANQCAVLNDDRANIGATIHQVDAHVDAGAVYAVVSPDLKKHPREVFIDLNNRAQAACIDIASRLHAGENLPTNPQDETIGKNLLLKDWVPSVRYAVAVKMRSWEQESAE